MGNDYDLQDWSLHYKTLDVRGQSFDQYRIPGGGYVWKEKVYGRGGCVGGEGEKMCGIRGVSQSLNKEIA